MARPLRIDYPGALQHVTNRGNNGERIFGGDDDKERFLALVIEEAERCGWMIHDYALMDNHFHLLIETPRANLSRGMQRLQTRYVQRFNAINGRTGHLFGGRFWSRPVEDGRYAMEVSRYIALNPVRAGMCARPEESRWSSYRAKAGLDKAPRWLSMRSLLDFDRDPIVAQDDFRRFVEGAIELPPTPSFLRRSYYGSDDFGLSVQAWVDREERSLEHPRDERECARPPLESITTAVCEVMERTPADLQTSRRGDHARLILAELGYWEGLRTLREIAVVLGLRSPSHVSSMVRRSRRTRQADSRLQSEFIACRNVARQLAPPLHDHDRARPPS